MGSCLSKKTTICSSSTTVLPDPPDQKTKLTPQSQVAEKKRSEDNGKKEIFLIKHRISHDFEDRKSDEEKPKSDPKSACIENNTPGTVTATTSEATDVGSNFVIGGGVVRTSSCSKEEIDAILIKCGRLSRSSSTGKTVGGCSGDRKYSGSKRSYDFDHDKGDDNDNDDGDVIDDWEDAERTHRHRQRHRQSSPSSSSGRRTTPSGERDQKNQRPRSRERGSAGGGCEGRRVSRSPGKRSESPIITITNTATTTTRPEKMVSVPATISSMSMDKSGIGGGGVEQPSAAAIKRILVKRNVGASASPRARSPAATRASNEKQNSSQMNQPLSLSRSNSRKAEISPYRRNPLVDIDQNCIGVEVSINKASAHIVSQAPIQKPNADNVKSKRNTVLQGTENRTFSVRAKEEQQQKIEDEGKSLHPNPGNITATMVPENLNHQTLTSTRSLRRFSQDLDFNPETLLNPSSTSYTALLLEDIQNFHQKGTPGMSLPHCLTKACSILEAVADLNSTTTVKQFGKNKKRLDSNEPFVDSEVVGVDDLMEPSFHKHVTVNRGGGGGGDTEEVESYGSNSFIGSGQNLISSSSLWESNSADSTDTWNPLRLGEKKSESDQKHNGIGRGRFDSCRGLQSTTFKAASS